MHGTSQPASKKKGSRIKRDGCHVTVITRLFLTVQDSAEDSKRYKMLRSQSILRSIGKKSRHLIIFALLLILSWNQEKIFFPAGYGAFPRGLAAVKSEGTSSTRTKTGFIVVPDRCHSSSRGQFDDIYARGHWGTKLGLPSDYYGYAHWPPRSSRKKSASGTGSELGLATELSLDFIINVTRRFGVKSLLDIPCGDVNWIFDSYETDSLPVYVGLDITQAVLELNSRRFEHHSNKKFLFWDATECPLPKFRNVSDGEEHPFDLVHVRDVIQHMNLSQGVQYMCNVLKSGANVLITTTFPKANNTHISEGGYYPNNLSREPFSFPASDDCILTHPELQEDLTCAYDLTVGTWRQEYIKTKCS